MTEEPLGLRGTAHGEREQLVLRSMLRGQSPRLVLWTSVSFDVFHAKVCCCRQSSFRVVASLCVLAAERYVTSIFSNKADFCCWMPASQFLFSVSPSTKVEVERFDAALDTIGSIVE
jgi:hypothetical protein